MGNSWTRLVQEAARYGGPNGLRQHYANAGAKAAMTSGRTGAFMLRAGTLVGGIAMGMMADKAFEMLKRKPAPEASAPVPEPAATAPETGTTGGPEAPQNDIT